jgi:aarF domain-containing kinase
MLLRDNFLHSDLHPGNILYQDHMLRTVPKIESEVRLVLLDFGIADELPVEVRNEFLTFLFTLVHKDGTAAANAILRWSSAQTCVGAAADALRADMTALVDSMCDLRNMRVDIDAVLKAVMVLLRQHKVAIDPVYATLVVGFANSLDKDLNLFEVAVSAFVSYSCVGEVVSGKLYQ